MAHVSGADEALLADARFFAPPLRHERGPVHMWLGVSVEDGTKKSRIRHLQDAPAGVRFLSIEPLIGPMGNLDLTGIDWVIVGGESGPGARVMNPDWVREVRDQCLESGVAFFFKQWGGLRPKSGGRKLDRREWNQFPKISPAPCTRPNDMVSLSDYTGREQSYVKHVFLERYLETLVHKTASHFRTSSLLTALQVLGKARMRNSKIRHSALR